MDAQHWQIISDLVLEPLKKNGARVWIYGSRALGTHKKYSDIDLLYLISTPLPRGLIGGIEEKLEESALPFKVDLVNEHNLAESYRANVQAQKVEV